MKHHTILACMIATSGIVFAPAAASAAFVLFENFDGLNNGALNGQNGWTANAVTTVAVESGADKVANIATGGVGNAANYKLFGPLAIPDANVASTVYFNFTLSSATGNNFNFIVTDVAAPPDTAGSSEVQLNTDNTAPAGGSVPTFRVNNGGTFIHLTTGQSGQTPATAVPLVPNSLYNVWFTINNSTDIYQVYMQNNDIASISAGPTQLFHAAAAGTGDFKFRNSGVAVQPNDLTTFNFGSTGTGSVVRVDDIYVDTAGANLVNPVPEPTALALALCGIAGLGLKRRRSA